MQYTVNCMYDYVDGFLYNMKYSKIDLHALRASCYDIIGRDKNMSCTQMIQMRKAISSFSQTQVTVLHAEDKMAHHMI